MPIHALLRLVIEARDVEEATALLGVLRPASSSHLLLGDAGGRVRGVEASPQKVAAIEPVDGALIHTNHFCDPELCEGDLGRERFPDTVMRLDRARDLLGGRRRWDTKALGEIFSDHHRGPSSICRHVDTGAPAHTRMETVGSFVFDLTQRTARVTKGQPCRSSPTEVTI